MSIVVGLHADRYALLAADCLQWTYTDHSCTTIAHESRRTKIAHTGLGLITGTGSPRLFDRVVARLAPLPEATPHTAPYLLKAAIDDERGAVEASSEFTSEFKVNALKGTCWLSTYAGDSAVTVAVYHPCLGDAIFPVKTGCAFAVMRPDSYDLYSDWLDRAVQVCAPGDDVGASIEHHVDVLRSLLRQYAGEPNAKSSAECTIGLHCDDGRRFLSPVLHPGDAFDWKHSLVECEPNPRGAAQRVA